MRRRGNSSPSRLGGMLVLLTAVLALFGIGVMRTVPQMERELASSVRQALRAGGFETSVRFTGQDAEVSCAAGIGDLSAARSIARSVEGVRGVTFSSSCSAAPTTTTTAPTTTAVPTTTAAPAPTTTEAATTTTTTTVTSTLPAKGELFSLVYADGRFVMRGVLASDTQQKVLESIAGIATLPDNVDDGTTVQEGFAITDRAVADFAAMVLAMPANVVSADIRVQHDGSRLSAVSVSAVAFDNTSRTAFTRAVTARGLSPIVQVRKKATAADATAVAADLMAAVVAEPLQFDDTANSSSLKPASMPVVYRIAAMARRFGGLVVHVEGFTESGGSTAANRVLSQRHATAVRAAMISLGVPARRVTAEGLGGSKPILDATGAEDAEASRRIEFRVTLG